MKLLDYLHIYATTRSSYVQIYVFQEGLDKLQQQSNELNAIYISFLLPGVGGVLPRDASPPPPKFPLDDPFVAYSRDDRAAEV